MRSLHCAQLRFNSIFEPKIVRKRQKDTSEIDDKIISMYTHGLGDAADQRLVVQSHGYDLVRRVMAETQDVSAGIDQGVHVAR